jgi:aryl-alcohol dehydrogenase-like predicted oxidoreductase
MVKRTGYPPVDGSDGIATASVGLRSRNEGVRMEYRPLRRTGITVSQLCLGGMMFGAFGNPHHDDPIKIIHRARDAGINFIDTADGYSAGESEQTIGKALAGGRRDSMVLAVKFGVPFGDADPNHLGASRRWITDAVEGSLRRLQTDWIDLYQVGVPDRLTDIDETLSALSDLVHAGKIRSFGASKVPASQIVEAQWTADRRGHERFRTEQPPYSLLTRAIEDDALPTCLRHGMGVMTYSPLTGAGCRADTARATTSAVPVPPLVRSALPRPMTPRAPPMRPSSTPPTPLERSPTRRAWPSSKCRSPLP